MIKLIPPTNLRIETDEYVFSKEGEDAWYYRIKPGPGWIYVSDPMIRSILNSAIGERNAKG